jgi:hypothetical protein
VKYKSSKPKTITTKIGKKVLREYRGYIIESYDLSQLNDSQIRGRAYSIWANQSDYDAGVDALSARDRIDYLDAAKGFVDSFLA